MLRTVHHIDPKQRSNTFIRSWLSDMGKDNSKETPGHVPVVSTRKISELIATQVVILSTFPGISEGDSRAGKTRKA